MEFNQEILLEKYPKPVSINSTKIMLNQLQNYICKIFIKKGGKGTGFFCNINYQHIDMPVLVTNFHVINQKYIEENDLIKITLNDDSEDKEISLKDNRIIYTHKDYDVTIIQIKPEKDGIKHFLQLDDQLLKDESNIFYDKQSAYIIQYPKGDKAAVSYGIIQYINNYEIVHLCSTESGSSGSPILNLTNNKIIGIHKEGSVNHKFNKGTFLKYPVNDFISKHLKDHNKKENEIEITVKINQNDVNKDIYFLDNTDYIEHKTNIKHFHDNLKELNETNVILYINNNRCKFQKYFKPDKEGIYIINLKFKIYLTDCSFMFAGCSNIINIDFSYFSTKNVANMNYMFSGCSNLT